MNKRLRLSEEQKKALSKLEPALRKCVASADLKRAKEIERKIQNLLEPTSHETRHLQAKNWLYETALEAGELSYAKLGLEETIEKSSPTTRLHLEAVSLLAICYLRERDIEKATVRVIDVIRKFYNIKTFWRREQFYRRLIIRLEQEIILVSLVNDEKRKLIVDEVEAETAKLVESKSQSEILLEMGNAVSRQSIEILSEIKAYLRYIRERYDSDLIGEYEAWELAHDDDKYLILPPPTPPPLPPPVDANNRHELGNRASSALKRVAWKALCSPDSEIYQTWNRGLASVYDMRVIATAIVAAFNSWSIGIPVLASSIAALAIKFGIDVFCETFAPESIMIDRSDNR